MMSRHLAPESRRIARSCRDDAGSAIVEFALIVPVFLILLFGVIEFGHAFWVSNVMASGVREGARIAAVQQLDPANLGNPYHIITDSAKARTASYINSVLGSSLTTANVSATIDAVSTSATYGQITVTLTSGGTAGYPYTPITPWASKFGLSSSMRFKPKAVFRYERLL